ncbi:FUSC family protein [Clostridium carnis]
MNKKLVVSKTIMFLVIVSFIILFKTIFGAENTLIGVTTVTAALMFLENDLTLSPFKNTFKLLSLNLFIGIAAYLANLNIWLAIPINFITVFIIGYLFCYDLKKPLYVPFLLQYLFILTAPVSEDKMYIRLISLVVGALLIMAAQLIANKDKLSKSGNKIISSICLNMISKIDLIKENKTDENINLNIQSSINLFRKMIYDKRKQEFYLTEEGRIKLNLSVALEKANFLLDKIKYTENNEKIFCCLRKFLNEIVEKLTSKDSKSDLSNDLQELLDKYEEENIEDLLVLQMLGSIKFINDTLKELQDLDNKKHNIVNKFEEIPENFKKISLHRRNLKSTSIKFSYAIKIAFGITICGFLMDYFELSEGRWMLFTILSLTTPLYEVSKNKVKDRLIGTIIGAIIIVILFSIFESTTIRTLILMVTGYISSYITKYKYNMICVTVSAIGAAAIMGNTEVLTVNRIIFVCIGAIIAILINKLILPYKVNYANENLKAMYKGVVSEMLKGIYNSINGQIVNNNMKNLLLITSLIEERLRLNNEAVYNNEDVIDLSPKRLLVINIYQLHMFIKRDKIKENDIIYILKDTQELIKYDSNSFNKAYNNIKNHISCMENIDDKIILSVSIETLNYLKLANN